MVGGFLPIWGRDFCWCPRGFHPPPKWGREPPQNSRERICLELCSIRFKKETAGMITMAVELCKSRPRTVHCPPVDGYRNALVQNELCQLVVIEPYRKLGVLIATEFTSKSPSLHPGYSLTRRTV